MTSLQIQIKSEPFMNDPEGAEAYYTALGRALILWGRFESHFDYLLDCICAVPAARHMRPEEMPISMRRKAELYRRVVKNVPRLAVVKDPILALLPDAMDAAQDRHVIVHGHWNGFIREDPLVGCFLTRKHKRGRFIQQKYDMSIETLEKMAATFDNLNTRLLPITFATVKLDPLKTSSQVPAPKE